MAFRATSHHLTLLFCFYCFVVMWDKEGLFSCIFTRHGVFFLPKPLFKMFPFCLVLLLLFIPLLPVLLLFCLFFFFFFFFSSLSIFHFLSSPLFLSFFPSCQYLFLPLFLVFFFFVFDVFVPNPFLKPPLLKMILLSFVLFFLLCFLCCCLMKNTICCPS